MARELGVLHPGHHRREQDQREPLPEQHGHPQAAERRGVRLFLGADDADKGEAPQGHHVLAVLGGLSAVPVRHGKLAERAPRRSHLGDAAALPQLGWVFLNIPRLFHNTFHPK